MMRDNTLWQKASGLRSNTKEQKRFLKFGIVGGIGAILDLAVLSALVHFLGWHPSAANTISVATAIVSNFLLNRFWSFPESRKRSFWLQFRQYTLINVAGYLFNQLIFNLLYLKGIPATVHLVNPWDYWVAKLIAIGIVLFWNYGVNRLTTYRGL